MIKIDSKLIKDLLLNYIEKFKQENKLQISNRLREIYLWIKKKKQGLLNRKKFVMDFLVELLGDLEIYWQLENLSPQDKQSVIESLSTVEQYWYLDLFPSWLQEEDPKLTIWKKKLMSEDFTGEDSKLIAEINKQIKLLNGEIIYRYILDLSMATDILVSSYKKEPLSVQLTTVSNLYLEEKQDNWLMTIIYWHIKRSLLLSYNPKMSTEYIAKFILNQSETQNSHEVIEL